MLSGACIRTCRDPGRRDRDLGHAGHLSGEARHLHDSNRHGGAWRSGRHRHGLEPCAAGWKRHHLSTLNTELESKRLEILKELVPSLKRVGVLTNAGSAYAVEAVQRLRRDAAAKGYAVEEAAARDRNDLDTQLQSLAKARPDAVVVVADSFLTANHARIAEAMADSRLPI